MTNRSKLIERSDYGRPTGRRQTHGVGAPRQCTYMWYRVTAAEALKERNRRAQHLNMCHYAVPYAHRCVYTVIHWGPREREHKRR